MRRATQSGEVRLLNGDARQLVEDLEPNSVDAVVTDPPYELGFMRHGWDAAGVAHDVGFWREVLRVAKPGAHLAAFGAPRTYHRLACAIEDAGWEVRDSLHWMTGNGFPKSHNLPHGLGTALKPGHEPCVLARKPLDGTVKQNVKRWGTGALNVDACRIPSEAIRTIQGGQRASGGILNATGGPRGTVFENTSGRWPANVMLDALAAAELDAQSGPVGVTTLGAGRGDRGGASRFFFVAAAETLCSSCQTSTTAPSSSWPSAEAAPFLYVSKPRRGERDAGVDHLPRKSGGEATRRKDGSAGLSSPRAGANSRGGRNHHPTVKPVRLMQYLVRLVTPAAGLVLDPFAGSGTTGIAAVLEHRQFIGFELEREYAAIAEARIAYAAASDGRRRTEARR